MSQGEGLVSVDHEVFEDFNGESTSGLKHGCSLSIEVVVSHDEPDQLLSLREEHETQSLVDRLG